MDEAIDDDGLVFAIALTKRVVMALPDEAFILSKRSDKDGSPVLLQQVGAETKRADLWNKGRALRQNGKGFYIFAYRSEMNAHLARRDEAFARVARTSS